MKPKIISIKKILEKVKGQKILLPAIQRNFVWKEEQISSFLDSLMRNYPTGALLLWKNPNKNTQMIEFTRNYVKRKTLETIDDATPEYCVLDGQQRITALYIAFKGSYEKKNLYFDSTSGRNDEEYSFAFLEQKEVDQYKEKKWVLVKDILKTTKFTKKRFKELNVAGNESQKAVRKIYNICNDEKNVLNYYEINEKNDDAILEIFKRINSGGTKLTKTDFLFSSLILSWKEGKNLVKNLVENVQDILGETSRIDGDFILRTAMYLIDSDTKVNIKNICSSKNINAITKNWNKIENSILISAKMIYNWGFNKDCITSFSAFLPIAYVAYHNFSTAKNAETVKKGYQEFLRKFFIHAQLNKLFNASVDNKLKEVKKCLECKNPWKALENKWSNVFKYDKEDAEKLLMKYSYTDKNYCRLILMLLNPSLNYSNREFHIDHLHPQSSFINKKNGAPGTELKNLSLGTSKERKWMEMSNQLPNLGLLMGPINQSKGDTPLKQWLKIKKHSGDYKDNLISKKFKLEFEKFDVFFQKRQERMIKKLGEILSSKPKVSFKFSKKK